MREITELNTAGFFPRLCAYALDKLILCIALFFAKIPMWVSVLGGNETFTRAVLFHYNLKDILCTAVVLLYFVIFTIRMGGTPGKLAMGLQVVSPEGSPCDAKTVIFRETVGRYLSGILCIGYFFIFGDGEHRALHDRIYDTRVVWKNREKGDKLRILTTNDAERDWYKPFRMQ